MSNPGEQKLPSMTDRNLTQAQVPQQSQPLGQGPMDVNNLISHAQNNMTQAALQQNPYPNNNNNNNNAYQNNNNTGSSSITNEPLDMASVLHKLQFMEKEKADLRALIQSQEAKLSKLTEGKRASMQELLHTTIAGWLKDLETKDEKTKKELMQGLTGLAEKGDESGVWEVVCCASAAHAQNVNKIESLTQENTQYKERERQLQGGLFQHESSRLGSISASDIGVGDKRKADDISPQPDIWGEFQNMLMSNGGNVGADYSGVM
jgi:hypothetical protein